MPGFMENFKKYPLKIIIIKAYDNGLDFVLYEGNYDLSESKTKDGTKQKRRLVARAGRFGSYFQLPWPSGKAQSLGDTSTRIAFLQTDVNSFYPITFQNGWLTAEIEEDVVEPVVRPVLSEKGEPVKNENGQFKYEYATGDDGNVLTKPVLDANGNIKKDKKDIQILPGGFFLKEGKLQRIPYAVANNVGSTVEWLASELQDARREERPRSQSLTDLIMQFGPWIALIIVAIFGGQAIMSFGASLQQATTINAHSAELIANATNMMAQAIMRQGIPMTPPV